MFCRQSHNRLHAWIAILAFLLAALVPPLTQWRTASRHMTLAWMEVCTTSGSKWVAVGATTRKTGGQAPGQNNSPAKAQAHAECSACLSHAHALDTGLLPPMALQAPAYVALADAVPPEPASQQVRHATWSPLSARAPPLQA